MNNPENCARYVKRRGLVAGAAALAAGLLGKLTSPEQAEAADGDTVLVGMNRDGTNNGGTTQITASTMLGTGPAFRVTNGSIPFSGGVSRLRDAMQGFTQIDNAHGVFGQGTGSDGIGVGGIGVRAGVLAQGFAQSPTSQAGKGLEALGGQDDDFPAVGVFAKGGFKSAGSGIGAAGVHGVGGFGASGHGPGVVGESDSGTGVKGTSAGNFTQGILGEGTGQAHGVTGTSINAFGLSGTSTNSKGLVGVNQAGNDFAGLFIGHGFNPNNFNAPGIYVRGRAVRRGGRRARLRGARAASGDRLACVRLARGGRAEGRPGRQPPDAGAGPPCRRGAGAAAGPAGGPASGRNRAPARGAAGRTGPARIAAKEGCEMEHTEIGLTRLKRRGLVAGAAALCGALLAKLAGPERAEAGHAVDAPGDPLHLEVVNNGAASLGSTNITGATALVANTSTDAFVARNLGAGASTAGLRGAGGTTSAGGGGTGLVGEGGTATTGTGGVGVRADGGDAATGTGGVGVQADGGNAIGGTGGIGVRAQGGFGSGVGGVGGNGAEAQGGPGGVNPGIGVSGTGGTASTPGAVGGPGMFGVGGFGAGGQGFGVSGFTTSAATTGVIGANGGSGPGVEGRSGNLGQGAGIGVLGKAGAGTGVKGTSAGNFTQGVLGEGTGDAHGVTGTSINAFGLSGTSTNAKGCVGVNTNGNDFAGLFVGHGANPNNFTAPGIYVKGRTVITGGVSATAVTSQGTRLLHGIQAADDLVEDVGRAQLQGGRARVSLDSLFAETIEADDYHVFLTPRSAASRGLAVIGQDTRGFTVEELGGGTGSYALDWRVVARRKGTPARGRLARADDPDLRRVLERLPGPPSESAPGDSTPPPSSPPTGPARR